MGSAPAKPDTKSTETQVKAYLAKLPADTQKALQQIRSAIRAAEPKATEAFAYGIPAFRLDGRPLVYYAGWKQHTSLYPITDAIRRANADALDAYETSKGTVRFSLARAVPSALVKRLVKARAAEVRAAAARKPARKRAAR